MKRQDNRLAAWADNFSLLFDPSPAQVALLDLNGVIVETNLAWKQFGRENGLATNYDCIGMNYLQACESAANNDEIGARQAYIGLLEVLRTQRPKFTMVYPCHSPTERRWYRMWVEPQLPQVPGIIVAHYLRTQKAPIDATKPGGFGIAFNTDLYSES